MSEQESEVREMLRSCLCRHCTNLATIAEESNSEEPLAWAADHILRYSRYNKAAAGIATDTMLTSEILKTIRQLSIQLDRLSDYSIMKLNGFTPRCESDPSTDIEFHVVKKEDGKLNAKAVVPARSAPKLFDARVMELKSLQEGIRSLHNFESQKAKETTSANYKAAAVAVACRKLWREEKGIEPPKSFKGGRTPTHPMAVMITEVFDILGVGADIPSVFNHIREHHRKYGDGALEESYLLSIEVH